MSKKDLTPPTPTLGQISILDDLPAQAPPKPRVADVSEVVRRVTVDPAALSRLATLLSVVALESAESREDQESVDLFVRGEHVTLVASAGASGRARLASSGRMETVAQLRCMPSVVHDPGHVAAIGLRIRAHDLVVALRNRIENSENFGVLSDPAVLEVVMDSTNPATASPAELRVYPNADISSTPRTILVAGLADLRTLDRLVLSPGSDTLPGLDAEALFEIAGITHPAAGVLVNPDAPRVLMGVNERGLLWAKMDDPSDADVKRYDDERQAYIDAIKNGDEADLVYPLKPLILSPRFASAAGLLQLSMEDALKVQQRAVNRQQAAVLQAATLAAALEFGPEDGLFHVYATVGAQELERILPQKKAGTQEEDAVHVARALSEAIEPQWAPFVASALYDLASATGRDTSAAVEGIEPHDEMAQDIARSWLAHPDSASARHTLAGVLGEVRVRQEIIRYHGEDVEAAPTRAGALWTHAAIAQAAIVLAGRQADDMLRTRIQELPDAGGAEFWTSLRNHLLELEAKPEVIDYVDGLRDKLKSAVPGGAGAELKIPSGVREKWLSACRSQVEGRFWSAPDGRAFVGLGDADDPMVGFVSSTDIALRPDPKEFPVREDEIPDILQNKIPAHWKANLWSADAQHAADRVTGVANWTVNEATPHPILVGRWSAPGVQSHPAGDLLDHFHELRHRRAETPQSVFADDASAAKPLTETRDSKMKVAPTEEAGSLRIFGFEVDGEVVHLDVPLSSVPRAAFARQRELLGAEQARTLRAVDPEAVDTLAFALEAEGLQDVMAFITQKATRAEMQMSEQTVCLEDSTRTRGVVLPKITATVVHPDLQPLLKAAGVGNRLSEEIPFADVFERAKLARQRRLVASQESIQTSRPELVHAVDWVPFASVSIEDDFLDRYYRNSVAHHGLEQQIQMLDSLVESLTRKVDARIAQHTAPAPKQVSMFDDAEPMSAEIAPADAGQAPSPAHVAQWRESRMLQRAVELRASLLLQRETHVQRGAFGRGASAYLGRRTARHGQDEPTSLERAAASLGESIDHATEGQVPASETHQPRRRVGPSPRVGHRRT